MTRRTTIALPDLLEHSVHDHRRSGTFPIVGVDVPPGPGEGGRSPLLPSAHSSRGPRKGVESKARSLSSRAPMRWRHLLAGWRCTRRSVLRGRSDPSRAPIVWPSSTVRRTSPGWAFMDCPGQKKVAPHHGPGARPGSGPTPRCGCSRRTWRATRDPTPSNRLQTWTRRHASRARGFYEEKWTFPASSLEPAAPCKVQGTEDLPLHRLPPTRPAGHQAPLVSLPFRSFEHRSLTAPSSR